MGRDPFEIIERYEVGEPSARRGEALHQSTRDPSEKARDEVERVEGARRRARARTGDRSADTTERRERREREARERREARSRSNRGRGR